MRRIENLMISRLLRQRYEAWEETDMYRNYLKLKLGEFLSDEELKGKCNENY